jgi:hypothetical protein
MLVYAHRTFPLNVRAFLRDFSSCLERLPTTPAHDAVVDLLVDFGEAYAAVADAWQPQRDDWIEPLQRWSDAAHATAVVVVASWHRDTAGVQDAIDGCRRAVQCLVDVSFEGDVSARTAEGFAYYALFPEQYILAAERFVREHAPSTLTCIGIRSIGAPLAHIVGAAAERRGVPARVFTVRPRGHPFDRRLEMTDALRDRLVGAGIGRFAIVDEGPGLSGSSFAAVSEALIGCGVEADRIVTFPSWCAPEDGVRSGRGREAIQRHRRFVVPFEHVWRPHGADDVSAGRWRARVCGADQRHWPAVHPQHERRKYLSGNRRPNDCQSDDSRSQRLMRFAGLGRYGRAKLTRAQALADGGFGPRPIELAQGFLTEEWVSRTAAPHALRVTPALLDRVAEYLAFVKRTFATGKTADVDDLVNMMNVNITEGLGPDRAALVDAATPDARQFAEAEVAIDGRMLPHEWIATPSGLLKADALDHHADDFLPGSRDIAWDVAGAIVELDLGRAAADYLVRAYKLVTGDQSIDRRLAFYEPAYLAFRLGYVTLAAESLGDSMDSRKFRDLQSRYRRSLTARAHSHLSRQPR